LFSCGVGLGFNPFITAAEPQGIKPSPRIKNKLKSEFPNDNFIIVLACDGKNKRNTVIRFHKFRKNEMLYDQKTINQFDYGKCPCGFLVEKI
jgi:hypothetical protein